MGSRIFFCGDAMGTPDSEGGRRDFGSAAILGGLGVQGLLGNPKTCRFRGSTL